MCGRTQLAITLEVDTTKPLGEAIEVELVYAPTSAPTKASSVDFASWFSPSDSSVSGTTFSPLVVNDAIEKEASAIRTVSANVRVISSGSAVTMARVQVKTVTGPMMLLHQVNVQAIVEPAMGVSSEPIKFVGETTVFLPNVLSLVWPKIPVVRPIDKIAEVSARLFRGSSEIMSAVSSVSWVIRKKL